jgi:hypothetical protein
MISKGAFLLSGIVIAHESQIYGLGSLSFMSCLAAQCIPYRSHQPRVVQSNPIAHRTFQNSLLGQLITIRLFDVQDAFETGTKQQEATRALKSSLV